ncbi:MAG: T9SS type A sorting domain-containing protein, partial [Ignavibacteriaceae bacterium]
LVNNSSPTLLWALPEAVETSLSYEIQLADNPYFINTKSFSPDASRLQLDNLEDGKAYFWKVRSKSADGKYSSYSDVGQFLIGSSVTDVENSLPVIPTEFVVEQNYPNPFNPVTTISFSIPETGFVTVKIFDMLGREVKTLLSSEKNPGNISVQWNGDNNSGSQVSSGTYIYRVTAGSQHKSFKMLLLK